MTKILKQGINQNLDNQILDILLENFRCVKTSKNLVGFLNRFLTPAEQLMIKKRLAIILLLQEGRRTKEIS